MNNKKMKIKNERYCKKGGVNPALSEIGRSEGQIFLMKNLGSRSHKSYKIRAWK